MKIISPRISTNQQHSPPSKGYTYRQIKLQSLWHKKNADLMLPNTLCTIILSLWAVRLDVEQSTPASVTSSGLIQSLTFVGIPSLSLTVKETMLLSKSGLRISCHGRQLRIKNSYNSKRGFFEHQMYKWVWQHNVGLSFLQLHFQWCKLHHIIWLQLFRLPYSSSSEHINCYEFNCSIHGDPRKVYFFITTNK